MYDHLLSLLFTFIANDPEESYFYPKIISGKRAYRPVIRDGRYKLLINDPSGRTTPAIVSIQNLATWTEFKGLLPINPNAPPTEPNRTIQFRVGDGTAGERTVDDAKSYNSSYVPFAADKPVVEVDWLYFAPEPDSE